MHSCVPNIYWTPASCQLSRTQEKSTFLLNIKICHTLWPNNNQRYEKLTENSLIRPVECIILKHLVMLTYLMRRWLVQWTLVPHQACLRLQLLTVLVEWRNTCAIALTLRKVDCKRLNAYHACNSYMPCSRSLGLYN